MAKRIIWVLGILVGASQIAWGVWADTHAITAGGGFILGHIMFHYEFCRLAVLADAAQERNIRLLKRLAEYDEWEVTE